MPAKGANPASAPMPSVFGDAAEQIRVMQDQQSGEIGVVDPRTLDACTDSCSSKLTRVFQECMPKTKDSPRRLPKEPANQDQFFTEVSKRYKCFRFFEGTVLN